MIQVLKINFPSDWGWDMEDNDTNPMDEEFLLSDFSHGIHVGSTIAMLNDGLDGNGMGARITPIRLLSGVAVEILMMLIYLLMVMPINLILASERVGDNLGIPVNQVTEKLHSINMSYGGGGSQTSQACVKLAELSETGILVVSSSGNSGIGSIDILHLVLLYIQLVQLMEQIEDQVTPQQINI